MTVLKSILAISSIALVSSGCVYKPDMTPTELQKWELANSQYVMVDDLRVHVVQSNSCNSSAGVHSASATGVCQYSCHHFTN